MSSQTRSGTLPCIGGIPRIVRLLVVCLSSVLGQAHASPIPVGVISFDVLIPGGSTPGVNAVSIGNLTGVFALPPEFPVVVDLNLQNTTVTVFFADGNSTLVTLGLLGPGFYTPPELQFADTVQVLAVSFRAQVAESVLQLADASSLNVLNSQVGFMLTPSSGETLTAGADFGIFNVDAGTGVSSSVPEPATGGLCLAIVAAIVLVRRNQAV